MFFETLEKKEFSATPRDPEVLAEFAETDAYGEK